MAEGKDLLGDLHVLVSDYDVLCHLCDFVRRSSSGGGLGRLSHISRAICIIAPSSLRYAIWKVSISPSRDAKATSSRMRVRSLSLLITQH
jgi:hypothetical protein